VQLPNPAHRAPFPNCSRGASPKTKKPRISTRPLRFPVECRGIEPLTSRVRLWTGPRISLVAAEIVPPLRLVDGDLGNDSGELQGRWHDIIAIRWPN
jgi:hypothetical protein